MPKKEDLTNVPQSVLDQQKAADDAIKKMGKPDLEPAQETALNTDPPAEPVVATEPATIEPTPVEKPVIGEDPEAETWKQKYTVLQGKYDAEVPRLQSQLVDLKAQIDRQSVVIEDLNSKVMQPQADETFEALDADEYEGWGPEMQKMAKRVNYLQDTIKAQKAQLENRASAPAPEVDDGLKTRIETLETEAVDNRVNSYINYLDKNIQGDWRAINKSPGFIAWTREIDPITTVPRISVLSEAAANYRGVQVASIFNSYIASTGGKVNVSVADSLPVSTGNGDETPAPVETMTAQDLYKAQNDFVQGRITDEEFNAIHAKFQKSLKR